MPSFGRGGVGNIEALQREKERVSQDVEAQQSNADKHLESQHSEPAQVQEYAHLGRGGMGNYYSPKELVETGKFSSTASRDSPPEKTDQNSSQSSTQPPRTGLSRMVGRGGAGNYEWGDAESRTHAALTQAEEDKKQEQIKAMVEEGVKEQLAFPQKAKVPGGEPY